MRAQVYLTRDNGSSDSYDAPCHSIPPDDLSASDPRSREAFDQWAKELSAMAGGHLRMSHNGVMGSTSRCPDKVQVRGLCTTEYSMMAPLTPPSFEQARRHSCYIHSWRIN